MNSKMLITDLPDHCLLMICNYCDIRSLATLSSVSIKFREFVRDMFFRNKTNYSLASANGTDIVNDLITVSRLVTTIKPKNFVVRIERNLRAAKDLPLISLDVNGSATEVFVESHFLDWLHGLNSICRQIQSIHIYISIYDCHNNDGVGMDNFTSWSNLKKMAFSGHQKNVHHFVDFPVKAWNWEVILFQNMRITAQFIIDALKTSVQLKNIIFENCLFSTLNENDVIAIAEGVRDRGGHFPLGLTFVNVEMECDGFLEAMDNVDVTNFIYIQFWNNLTSVENNFMLTS